MQENIRANFINVSNGNYYSLFEDISTCYAVPTVFLSRIRIGKPGHEE